MDVDDTTNCPISPCSGCGADQADLVTAECMYGVYCLPLCSRCQAKDRPPEPGHAGAADAVLSHCEHLNITLDQNRRAAGLPPLLDNKYPCL